MHARNMISQSAVES